MDCVVVGYGEIALKGGNRRSFEDALKRNLASRLEADGIGFSRVYKASGRIIVDAGDAAAAAESISRVFGVTSASPAVKVKAEVGEIKDAARAVFARLSPKPESFRVSARRLEKKINETSQDINELVGAEIAAETGCAVKLKNPEAEVGVEVAGNEAYVFTRTFSGVGGLPVGVAGKVVVLLSGGIDSPVAAFLCMKRGCEVILLHFAHAGSAKKPPAKIEKIRRALERYCSKIRLACVPAGALEREIVMKTPSEYRIIILRRMMLRAAEKIAKKSGALALASGDNLGQVASQTLANLGAIDSAVGMLCLRPLVGFDKREIVDFAKKIGTYEHSIEPHADCCSFLVARHPQTAAKKSEAEEIEEKIDFSILDEAIKGAALS